jgi:phosphatidate phosphatase APP1
MRLPTAIVHARCAPALLMAAHMAHMATRAHVRRVPPSVMTLQVITDIDDTIKSSGGAHLHMPPPHATSTC